MIQIDLFKIRTFCQKYLSYVLALIIIIIILFDKCNNTNPLELENKILNKQITDNQILVKSLIEKSKQDEKLISNYKDSIVFLDSKSIKNKKNIQSLSNKNKQLKTKVNKLDNNGLVNFYIDRYKKPKEIFKTDIGINFTDTISKEIALELTDYDYISKVLTETESLYSIEKNKSIFKDSIINLQTNQKKYLNFAIVNQDSVIDNQNKLIKNQFNIIKKEKRKNTLYKYALPISILGGVFGGFLISK